MQIEAKIVAMSKNPITGTYITTFELSYPRFIHGEFKTHRTFSSNSASSRAINTKKMAMNLTAEPLIWNKEKSGMSAGGELGLFAKKVAQFGWWFGKTTSQMSSGIMKLAGLHKQWSNRVTEPYQMIKTVVTMTELSNFLNLRIHWTAQPEINELANLMLDEYTHWLLESKYKVLNKCDWHVPYYHDGIWAPSLTSEDTELVLDNYGNDLQSALKISASVCAQTSFRLSDDSLEKAEKVYGLLIESEPVHASPIEHQATIITYDPNDDMKGVTHITQTGTLCSGNFANFIQHRQLINNHDNKVYLDGVHQHHEEKLEQIDNNEVK